MHERVRIAQSVEQQTCDQKVTGLISGRSDRVRTLYADSYSVSIPPTELKIQSKHQASQELWYSDATGFPVLEPSLDCNNILANYEKQQNFAAEHKACKNGAKD